MSAWRTIYRKWACTSKLTTLPVPSQDGKSPFHGRLNKFNTIQWMVKVFQSDNYCIYRLNLPAKPDRLPTPTAKQRGQRGNLLQGKLSVNP